jgi:hypothetical protein
MFRRKEHIISNDLLQENNNNIVYVWSEDIESIDTGVKYPVDMDEIRGTYAMCKDGKSYWHDATKKDLSK